MSESEYCDRVGVIRKGRLIAVDTPVGLRRTTLGGDIVDVEATGLNPAVVNALMQPDFVTEVKPISRTQVRAHVKEAGPAIPALLEILNNSGATVQRIEEYKPNFDEIFIELMKKDAAARGEDENDAGTD